MRSDDGMLSSEEATKWPYLARLDKLVFLAVPSGWYPKLNDLWKEIEPLSAHFDVVEVKRKFGTLRFYLDEGGLEPSSECEKAREIIWQYTLESGDWLNEPAQ